MPSKRGAPLEGVLIVKMFVKLIGVSLAATNGPPAPLRGECQLFEFANELPAGILALLNECRRAVHHDPPRILVGNILDASVPDFVRDQ